MATTPLFADRVQETSTTTGTGTYTLAGAVTGYQTFAAIGNSVSCYYCAMEVDGDGNPSGGWEVGVGTYTTSGTTLSRDTILASSNAGSAVSWAAGTRRIFVTLTAVTAVQASAGLAPTAAGRLGYDTTLGALVSGGHGAIKGFVHRIVRQQVDTTDTLTASTIGTSETAFTKKFVIPANFLQAGKGLRVTPLVQVTTSASAPTTALRLRAGGAAGTLIYSNNGLSFSNNLTNRGFGGEILIFGTAAPGSVVAVITTTTAETPGGGAIGFSGNVTAASQNLATNTSLDLVVTAQYSANTAGNSITLLALLVEELTGD